MITPRLRRWRRASLARFALPRECFPPLPLSIGSMCIVIRQPAAFWKGNLARPSFTSSWYRDVMVMPVRKGGRLSCPLSRCLPGTGLRKPRSNVLFGAIRAELHRSRSATHKEVPLRSCLHAFPLEEDGLRTALTGHEADRLTIDNLSLWIDTRASPVPE